MRFSGQIAGLGSTSGVRVVVGTWRDSPLGDFTDVMVEQADGWRTLLAPSAAVADFVATTYVFDEVVLGPVRVIRTDAWWAVDAPGLALRFTVGGRSWLGLLLGLVPRRLATGPAWLTLINPIARLLVPGVRTRGSAQGGRTEFYGAYDVRAVVSASGAWRGVTLGDLADVHPPVRFGFGSTPRRPVVTSLVTTVVSAEPAPSLAAADHEDGTEGHGGPATTG